MSRSLAARLERLERSRPDGPHAESGFYFQPTPEREAEVLAILLECDALRLGDDGTPLIVGEGGAWVPFTSWNEEGR